MARLRNFSQLPKSVWSLGYRRLAFLTLSSSHFDPNLPFRLESLRVRDAARFRRPRSRWSLRSRFWPADTAGVVGVPVL